MLLHGYWRSGTSYRVRIALNLKGLDYEQCTHDLRTGAQHEPAYKALNPQGLMPALEADGLVLVQSPAILEWIEERYPDPPLLPRDPASRAIVRAMAATIGCDIHPLNNLRVLQHLRRELDASEEQIADWASTWITGGFAALERLVDRHGKGFAFGAAPSLADCYLVPQIYSAERFNVDLSPYPALIAAAGKARALEPFRAAHPALQPDADPE